MVFSLVILLDHLGTGFSLLFDVFVLLRFKESKFLFLNLGGGVDLIFLLAFVRWRLVGRLNYQGISGGIDLGVKVVTHLLQVSDMVEESLLDFCALHLSDVCDAFPVWVLLGEQREKFNEEIIVTLEFRC